MKNVLQSTLAITAFFIIGSLLFYPVLIGKAQQQPSKSDQLTSPASTTTPTPELAPTITSDISDQSITPTSISTQLYGNQEILNLVFPTPGPAPISAWRPPLYPVPWAAGEHDHFYFQRPIAADEINWPVADYRYGGVFFGPSIVHTGVDIDAPLGTPVIAAASGKVVWVGYGLFTVAGNMGDPYGLAVAIRHDFGINGKRLYTVYAHMRKINVIDGQQISAGDQIGEVGETGATTGPHLHFEVRLGRNYFFDTRNPELWMAPPQGWGVLVAKITDKKGKNLTHKEVHVYALYNEHEWVVRSYGPQVVNPDEYFQENLVLSDLPAGKYRIKINYAEHDYYGKFEIEPGKITMISYAGENGFSQITRAPAFTPVAATPAP